MRGLIPGGRVERLYAFCCLVTAVGTGLFLSGTAVFATRLLRLSPQQSSLGFSAAGLAALLASASVGRFIDRFGARRTLLVVTSLAGIVDLGYCFLRSFPAFMVLTCLAAALTSCIIVARAAYAASIAVGPELIRLRAQSRSMGNAGFGAGAGLAAVALAVGTTPVLYMLPIGDAASFGAMAVLTASMPAGRTTTTRIPARALPASRNVPYLIATGLNAILRMHESLILIVVPLWIVARTSAPKALIGLLLVLNTAGCVLFQVKASAGAQTVAGSVRKVRVAAAVLSLGCVLLALSGHTLVALTVLLVTAGYVALTAAELLQCAGEWGLMYALAPPDAQGDYAGAFGISGAAQQIVGPGLGGWLVLRHGTSGWLILGAVVVLAAGALGPVARWNTRMMERRHAEIKPVGTAA